MLRTTAYDGAVLTGPEDHARVLHAGGLGRVTLARRGGGRWREHSVPAADLAYAVRHLAGEADVYLTQNRFWTWRRAVASLAQLDALFVDLDHYRTAFAHLRPHQLLDVVLPALEEARIPPPSFAVATGRGLALVWLHAPVPRAALPRWRACQRRLRDVLRPYGADPLAADAARVLRLIGTRNGASGAPVEALTTAAPPWDFDALADEVLPLARGELVALGLERAKRRADGRLRATPPRPYTWETLWEGRLAELQRLRWYRWLGALPPGQRDAWLFVAGIAVSWLAPPQVLRRELHALAREAGGWSGAETDSRLQAVFARAGAAARGERVEWQGRLRDPRYWRRDETIVEQLAITEAEMRALGFRHLASADIKREHERGRGERRRRAAGVVPRAAYEANSLSRLKPWEAEGISRRTWERRHAKGRKGRPPAPGPVASPSGCMVAKPPTKEVPVPPACPEERGRAVGSGASRRITLPPTAQLGLFDDGGPAINDADLDRWARGIAPPAVVTGIRHELRRRGLRQHDLARRLGISRPQLTNGLRGRFGLGPAAVAGLKAFLLEAATAAA